MPPRFRSGAGAAFGVLFSLAMGYDGAMNEPKLGTIDRIARVPRRVLVTGTRGKSSLVRMIAAGLGAGCARVRARITGVLPREISPAGERQIVRNGPGHVEEMRWWLGTLPADTEAIVMENSAVCPELQHLAALWLRPTVTVWTNAYEDHHEAWGKGRGAPVDALIRGIPADGVLVTGAALAADQALTGRLAARTGETIFTNGIYRNFLEANRALAKTALTCLDAWDARAERALCALPPDIADFRVFEAPRFLLAAAFSANDVRSTEALFASTGWTYADAVLLYGDRRDRTARRRAFTGFMAHPWRCVCVLPAHESPEALAQWIEATGEAVGGRAKIFGCGNVAGAPLALLEKLTKEGCRWTIPGASV